MSDKSPESPEAFRIVPINLDDAVQVAGGLTVRASRLRDVAPDLNHSGVRTASPLQNRFLPERDGTPAECQEKYRRWLKAEIDSVSGPGAPAAPKDVSPVVEELRELVRRAREIQARENGGGTMYLTYFGGGNRASVERIASLLRWLLSGNEGALWPKK